MEEGDVYTVHLKAKGLPLELRILGPRHLRAYLGMEVTYKNTVFTMPFYNELGFSPSDLIKLQLKIGGFQSLNSSTLLMIFKEMGFDRVLERMTQLMKDLERRQIMIDATIERIREGLSQDQRDYDFLDREVQELGRWIKSSTP